MLYNNICTNEELISLSLSLSHTLPVHILNRSPSVYFIILRMKVLSGGI